MSVYVYVIVSADYGRRPLPVKVGSTGGVDSRAKEIQACCPYPLVVFNAVKCDGLRGAREVERLTHKALQSKRIHGEWFETLPDHAWSSVLSNLGEPTRYSTYEQLGTRPIYLQGRKDRPALTGYLMPSAPISDAALLKRVRKDDPWALKELRQKRLSRIGERMVNGTHATVHALNLSRAADYLDIDRYLIKSHFENGTGPVELHPRITKQPRFTLRALDEWSLNFLSGPVDIGAGIP